MKNALGIAPRTRKDATQAAMAMMLDAAKPLPDEWLLNAFYVICADRGMGAGEFEAWANSARMKLEIQERNTQ